jgi:hypothetical protein
VAPQAYLSDAVEKFLFSRDRNPNVILPPVAAPKPVMPPLPAAFGLMLIDEPTLILSAKGKDQHGYHPGDMVGDFKLVAFNEQTVEFEWNGEKVERPLADLVAIQPKVVAPASSGGAAPAGSQPATPAPTPASGDQGSRVTTVELKSSGPLGPEMTPTRRACLTNDSSPAGTVSEGFTKKVSMGPFGESCSWDK